MSGHLVHLVGPPLRAGDVIRQRCAWCGALIDEYDLTRVAIPEGDPPLVHEDGTPCGGWTGLVAVAEGSPTVKWAVENPPDGRMPEDSCMALDPEVTR